MDGELNGPIFNPGEWDAIMADGLPGLVDDVADTVLEMWRDTLDYNIRVNHGAYVSETRVTREESAAVLNDGTSLYGPWLEGTGTRNYPRTRFKGYQSAERTTERAQDSVDTIAEGPLGAIVEGLNA